MAYDHFLTDDDIQVTKPALEKIGELINDTDGEAFAVRIYVSGGGCSGMSYGMTFAENAQSNDSVMKDEAGTKLVIDPVARNFLQGAEIDYLDDGINSKFVFNNVFQTVGGSGACGGCGGM